MLSPQVEQQRESGCLNVALPWLPYLLWDRRSPKTRILGDSIIWPWLWRPRALMTMWISFYFFVHPSVHPESGTLLAIEGIKQELERAQQDQPKTQRTFGSRKFQKRKNWWKGGAGILAATSHQGGQMGLQQRSWTGSEAAFTHWWRWDSILQ